MYFYIFRIELNNLVLSNFNQSTFKRQFLFMLPNIMTTSFSGYVVYNKSVVLLEPMPLNKEGVDG